MRFNPKARLDTGRVSDGGGGGGGFGGGMRLPIPGGRAGGGVGGLLVILLILVLTRCLGGGGGGGGTSGGAFDTSQVGGDANRYANCQTGADANADVDCARIGVENSLRDYWAQTLPEQKGVSFEAATMRTFSGSVSTGCGNATSQVGPFYCPVDSTIYMDTSFFKEVLQRELGGPSGAFVEPYVLAHEYGHHIQNLLGTMGQVRTQQGPRSDAVRLELQADCFAGMWAQAAPRTRDSNGDQLISEITEQDAREAIKAAEAVGDDRIQQKTQGQVTQESWTHGSAESRVKWFKVGFSAGTIDACDTWAVDTP
jgi:predicted metalloprotease